MGYGPGGNFEVSLGDFTPVKDIPLTLAGTATNFLSTSISLKTAERSEVESAKRSFASKFINFYFMTRSFASRFQLRFAQPFFKSAKRSFASKTEN